MVGKLCSGHHGAVLTIMRHDLLPHLLHGIEDGGMQLLVAVLMFNDFLLLLCSIIFLLCQQMIMGLKLFQEEKACILAGMQENMSTSEISICTGRANFTIWTLFSSF